MMHNCWRLFWAILCFQVCSSAKLPDSWKSCPFPDSNNEECLKREIEHAIKDLKNGNSNFGMPPLNPLRIDAIRVTQGNGPVKINLNLTNYDIYGLQDIKIKSLKNDWKTLDITFTFPAHAKSDYKISGQVLVLPINGDGRYEFDSELTMRSVLHLSEKTKKGKQYFHIDKIDCTSEVDSMHIKFDNLFNGNKQLGDQMNAFLNENWRDINNELSPLMNDATCQAAQGLANQIFSRIPKDELIKK